jgi:hypothetical protein
MKKLIYLISILAFCFQSGAQSNLSSSFNNTSLDGWKLNVGTMSNPGKNGYNGGGYLHIKAPGEGITSYLTAPSKYHGNWTNAKTLRLRIWIGKGEYYTKRSGAFGDIILKNGTKTARYYFPKNPPSSPWGTFEIPLNSNSGWTIEGGANNISDVLNNITDFQIRAEYIIGDTETGIDEVEVIGINQTGNVKPENNTSATSHVHNELPINVIGSWSSGGRRNNRGRLNIWQEGNHFVVVVSWIDEEINLWKSYKGEGEFEGREMNFIVYPSVIDGKTVDQGYVYHYKISPDNNEIVGYYTRYGKRTTEENSIWKRVE